MSIDLNELVNHDMSEDCPICRTQTFVDMALVPAAAAWEQQNDLPRLALALHGAAGLLGAMMREGVSRAELEGAMSQLLDEIEQETALGGPPQGTA